MMCGFIFDDGMLGLCTWNLKITSVPINRKVYEFLAGKVIFLYLALAGARALILTKASPPSWYISIFIK